jgi:hypothetical protein
MNEEKIANAVERFAESKKVNTILSVEWMLKSKTH